MQWWALKGYSPIGVSVKDMEIMNDMISNDSYNQF